MKQREEVDEKDPTVNTHRARQQSDGSAATIFSPTVYPPSPTSNPSSPTSHLVTCGLLQVQHLLAQVLDHARVRRRLALRLRQVHLEVIAPPQQYGLVGQQLVAHRDEVRRRVQVFGPPQRRDFLVCPRQLQFGGAQVVLGDLEGVDGGEKGCAVGVG